MAIGSGMGVEIRPRNAFDVSLLFAEQSAGYLLEIDNARLTEVGPLASRIDAVCERIGTVTEETDLVVENLFSVSVDKLTKAWRGTLDW